MGPIVLNSGLYFKYLDHMVCSPWLDYGLSGLCLLKNCVIRPLETTDLENVRLFCDSAIGQNYYSLIELQEIHFKSLKDQEMCSLVLLDPSRPNPIVGIRITFPPGNWNKGKGTKICPHLWKISLSETAYFQSLFVAQELQGQGWGPKLSIASMTVLRTLGAKAVVCHSWVESPGDSSRKYARNLGFETVAWHSNYWNEVDYICPRCSSPCVCTAEEMICYL